MIKRIFITIIVLLFLTGFSTAAENACVGCHTSVGATKGIINDWKESKHALKNGVRLNSFDLSSLPENIFFYRFNNLFYLKN